MLVELILLRHCTLTVKIRVHGVLEHATKVPAPSIIKALEWRQHSAVDDMISVIGTKESATVKLPEITGLQGSLTTIFPTSTQKRKKTFS